MSEKLCLQWHDFQENLNTAFGNLREDNEFADMTLACEDGQQIEAHKVILAASSPCFQTLLKRNKHPHPLIYMRGVKYENLLAIVDFLYCGEANIFQENLDSFLAIAEELKLKGLMGQTENVEKKAERNYTDQTLNPQTTPKPFHKKEKTNMEPKVDKQGLDNERRIAIPNVVSANLQELDEKVKSMMERSDNLDPSGQGKARICSVCGKEGHGMAIRDHIEANHLEGVALPCNVCERTFRSRMILRKHKCT